ncbi:carboxylesterase [Alcanivorax sp. N3-2A]|nr:carboxylesterase [Alcanivorax sp. N3-2A]|tara:strand:+ start:2438 stop:3373 length:936 start_codon:yes stop_codon:yes gene_type:complete
MSTVNPGLRPWLDNLNQLMDAARASHATATPVNVREALANMTAALVSERPDTAWVGDAMVDTGAYPVPVRLYDPAPEKEKPVCLFFHGGGHMAGSITVYDPICRKLARASGQLVVSVEYRLAPECPYPRGLEDCLAVARHIWPTLEHKQRKVRRRLALVGDSGGGTLAASVSALARDDDALHIDKQVLIYPSLDYALEHPSIHENGRGYLLEEERIHWYFDAYFKPGDDRRAASPLHMGVNERLPETLVVTAGFCPLRDEALAYLERLDQARVPNQHLHLDDMIHAYLNLEDLVPEACAQTYRAIGGFLRG